jgi:zinc/manganese transport system substrate-binding protein
MPMTIGNRPCWRRAGLVALMVVLAGCGTPRGSGGGEQAGSRPDTIRSSGGTGTGTGPGRSRLRVVTTVLPVTLFTRAVAGDCATVTPLIPASGDAHDVQARPGDLLALRQARVVVTNGLGIDGFLDGLLASAANPQLQRIDSSHGVASLGSGLDKAAQPADGPGDDHRRDQDTPDPDHGPENGGHTHGHAGVNPHIWLDPRRAEQQVATIRDGLVRADPACAEGYRRNAEGFSRQLRALDAEIAAQLRPYRQRTFVTFHDVAPYFAERYDLKASFLVAMPEIRPSPADLQRVATEVQRNRLRALLGEPRGANRPFQALASDLGVSIGVFDPIETTSEQEARDPATYFLVMRRNVTNLRQAFGG